VCTPTEIRLLDEYKLVQLKKTQEKNKKEDGIKKRDELNSQQKIPVNVYLKQF